MARLVMGLNRIVTLFHSKLNTLGDNGRRSSVSGNDSTDFDSSLSSSVESLMLPSPGGVMCEAEGDCGVGGATASLVDFPFVRDVNNNNNNISSSCCPPPPANEFSPPFRRFQSISNTTQKSSIVRELSTSDSLEDVLLVLGTEAGSRTPACHAKRSSALSRRFSLKAKFSSDLDLYGKMNRMAMPEHQQEDEAQQQQGSLSLGKHLKKSIWSSFRLPVRLLKGKGRREG